MKPIATANYDFRCLVEGGYVYVDKTDMLFFEKHDASHVKE